MEQSFTFNNAKVKYVSTKEQYCCDVSYFVIDHEKTKEQFKAIEEKYKDLKMPFFSDDTGDYIMKVKSKFITDADLELKNKYKCNLNFEYYNYNGNDGFYIKMDKITLTSYNTSKDSRKVININN